MSSIFLIGPDNQLTELRQAEYDSEELLQKLLADHPDLLGVSGSAENGLLLVRRELGVPESEDGADRWSLDHLFLDRDGVPVLVEVKRASDTRARREVVAQMLDYAADGVAYWSIDKIVGSFGETCLAAKLEANAELAAFVPGGDIEAFWRQVEVANLRSGRVRMIFVADRIPRELRRIVEFLNEQMRPAEVLAIEVEQFTNANGLRTLVPRALGNTERAQSSKSVAPSLDPITEEEWLANLEHEKGPSAKTAADMALSWFREHGFRSAISQSQDSMSLRLTRPDGKFSWPFFVRRSNGKLEASLQYLKEDPAFASDEIRAHLLAAFQSLPGVTISTTKLTGWPAIPLEDLHRPDVWKALQQIALQIKAAAETGQPSYAA